MVNLVAEKCKAPRGAAVSKPQPRVESQPIKKNMNTQKSADIASKAPRNFLARLFEKLDHSLKQKAEEKAKQSGCCSGDKGKGGKCC